jgi:uncharacterized protein (DUF433 family)
MFVEDHAKQPTTFCPYSGQTSQKKYDMIEKNKCKPYPLKGKVPMNERIQIDPKVCHGKPVIRGTRVLVSTLLGALSGGDSIGELLADYPNIGEADIRAALAFAGDLSRFEESSYEETAQV